MPLNKKRSLTTLFSFFDSIFNKSKLFLLCQNIYVTELMRVENVRSVIILNMINLNYFFQTLTYEVFLKANKWMSSLNEYFPNVLPNYKCFHKLRQNNSHIRMLWGLHTKFIIVQVFPLHNSTLTNIYNIFTVL